MNASGDPNSRDVLRRIIVSDGPFPETKEFGAGLFVIGSDSKAEAIEWARRLMHTNVACEVRPLWSPA